MRSALGEVCVPGELIRVIERSLDNDWSILGSSSSSERDWLPLDTQVIRNIARCDERLQVTDSLLIFVGKLLKCLPFSWVRGKLADELALLSVHTEFL